MTLNARLWKRQFIGEADMSLSPLAVVDDGLGQL